MHEFDDAVFMEGFFSIWVHSEPVGTLAGSGMEMLAVGSHRVRIIRVADQST